MTAARKHWKVALAGLVAFMAVAQPLQTEARETSLSDIRQLPQGSTVTVVGVVTTPSGAFAPNDTGFAIQNGKSGLYIHSSLDQNLQVGQLVQVTGTLADNFGLVLGVEPTTIEVLGTAQVRPPHPEKTGNVTEETEGILVRIKGTIVTEIIDDAPYGWKFNVDDGTGYVTVFVYTGTGIDVSALQTGQRVDITGFSGQFIDHYEVTPRFQDDISILK
jgi:hypothetical protein